jgi:hypothetical protein
MKKVILILFPIILLVGTFFIMKTENPSDIKNIKQEPLEFKDNQIQCPQCNMFLVGKKYTAETVTSDGKTHFFDDPGCLVLWVEENVKDDKSLVSWVYTLDTNKWVKANSAFYSINDSTPMHYGFGAYESSVNNSIKYEEMKLRMLRGENMTNPKIRKKIMESSK